ncbi:hypothetical protein [Legionella quateirensis]|uniref:Uncharacterized protein n=1 Tax=Legionella quateirensis TaxID=45072 RepID=A0A378KV15_9GAMM|nr:hypothetical protein [Legionella quateirensis]KTD45178.1 hypothetical protein Lqua_2639 [Legionella quateirensis]STY18425.1 Uncharacterised protein [Legionella quateirensis]
MIRLEELLYSLTTVIIRYHDNLMGKKLITAKDIPEARLKSRELAIAIIQNKDNDLDFSTRLKNIIVNCTAGYADRQPFLYYILNEAVLINSYLNRKTSFTSEEFTEYKGQILKLLIDIKGLLCTKKSGRYEVTQHQTDMSPKGDIALSGCINERYVGDYFCNSGIFLNQEVLETLNISHGFSEERFEEFANRICMEHQNALLVPEQQAKILGLEEENSNQKQTIESLSQKTEEAQSSSSVQVDLVKQQEEIIRQLQETVAQQAEQLKLQEEKINEQNKQLVEQFQRPKSIFGGMAYNPLLFAYTRFPRVAESSETTELGLAGLGINE